MLCYSQCSNNIHAKGTLPFRCDDKCVGTIVSQEIEAPMKVLLRARQRCISVPARSRPKEGRKVLVPSGFLISRNNGDSDAMLQVGPLLTPQGVQRVANILENQMMEKFSDICQNTCVVCFFHPVADGTEKNIHCWIFPMKHELQQPFTKISNQNAGFSRQTSKAMQVFQLFGCNPPNLFDLCADVAGVGWRVLDILEQPSSSRMMAHTAAVGSVGRHCCCWRSISTCKEADLFLVQQVSGWQI